MARKSFDDTACPVARSLDKVGDGWSLLILRDAYHGLARFDQFEASLGIASNILSNRLGRLVEEGFLERQRYNDRPPRYEYHLTRRGHDFRPVLIALSAFGDAQYGEAGRTTCLVDVETGEAIDPVLTDRRSGAVIETLKLAPRIRPLADEPQGSI
jgi:DNA-binding HxlR family transcriptional regulator